MIKLIVAMTKNGVMGKGNALPWDSPEELSFFREMTLGHSILMGQITVENLPHKLKDRTTYAMTLNKVDKIKNADHVIYYIEDILEKFANSDEIIFIAGGKQIYERFYKYAKELYISEMKKEYPGDKILKLNLSNYDKTLFKKGQDFDVYKYTRRDND